ncbi:MAG: hypothetical protein E7117_04530 [Bacteroidales bacterium]|nr:hypothetical protein [Bacteroidales bacterium]
METPFVYNKPVEYQDFIEYESLQERIADNMRKMKNTVVLGAKKTGKTSLLKNAASKILQERCDFRVCSIDVGEAGDKENYLAMIADGVVRAVSEDFSEAAAYIKLKLPEIEPRISVESGDSNKFHLRFDKSHITACTEKFIDLPEQIAKEKEIRLVVIIENFQTIMEMPDYEEFMNRIGEAAERHENVVYCFSANKRYLMSELLKKHPIGEAVHMTRIPEKKQTEYICRIFSQTAKYIDEETASLIVTLAEGQPYHMQQIAQVSWLRTYVVCTKEIVWEAHQALIDQMSMVFADLTEMLTPQQICYLRAIVSGEQVISTTDILHKYGITSATSASRSKSALLNKDIIDVIDGKNVVLNPLYTCWIRKTMTKNSEC